MTRDEANKLLTDLKMNDWNFTHLGTGGVTLDGCYDVDDLKKIIEIMEQVAEE